MEEREKNKKTTTKGEGAGRWLDVAGFSYLDDAITKNKKTVIHSKPTRIGIRGEKKKRRKKKKEKRKRRKKKKRHNCSNCAKSATSMCRGH